MRAHVELRASGGKLGDAPGQPPAGGRGKGRSSRASSSASRRRQPGRIAARIAIGYEWASGLTAWCRAPRRGPQPWQSPATTAAIRVSRTPVAPDAAAGPRRRPVHKGPVVREPQHPEARWTAPGSSRTLRVEVNVNATKIADKMFESAIHLKAEATSQAGAIYDLELSYAGMFEIQNIPEAGAGAVPADQLSVAVVSLPAPPGGRPDAGRRLPAVAARPHRFRRALRPEAATGGRAGHQAGGELKGRHRPQTRR